MSQNNQQYEQLHLLIDREQWTTINLVKQTYSIGRDHTNDIRLESRVISRFHATLVKSADARRGTDAYKLVDGTIDGKPSFNGIMVNGKHVHEHVLVSGDLISFGGVIEAIFRAPNHNYNQNIFASLYKYSKNCIRPAYWLENEATAIKA